MAGMHPSHFLPLHAHMGMHHQALVISPANSSCCRCDLPRNAISTVWPASAQHNFWTGANVKCVPTSLEISRHEPLLNRSMGRGQDVILAVTNSDSPKSYGLGGIMDYEVD